MLGGGGKNDGTVIREGKEGREGGIGSIQIEIRTGRKVEKEGGRGEL